ncbi:hypothetical protein PLICRDRAFT_176755 [Plicaturopsis crispa FD-325 SS-3]|nr:hypothetical protein PLICRDRAFT_176755 [Plicaturopsis crispa FD-325 SS-3]
MPSPRQPSLSQLRPSVLPQFCPNFASMAAAETFRPTKGQLALDAGPYLLGTGVNWALLGCLSVQVYLYSLSSTSDRRAVKVLVYAVYLVDIIQTVIATYCAWVQLIYKPYGYGDVLEYDWSNVTLSLFAGTVSFTVQCFFAWRIWVLQDTGIMRKLVVCIVMLAVVQCSGAIAVSCQFFIDREFKRDQAIEPSVIWLGASLLCDILLAGCLSHFLRVARNQTPFAATKTILTKLLILTVQSGVITAVAAGMQLAAFTAGSLGVSNYWDMGLALVLGKLYSNMLLASLNARTVVVRISDTQADLPAVEGRSDQGIVFRVAFTEVTATAGGNTVTTETHCDTPPPQSKEHVESSGGARV